MTSFAASTLRSIHQDAAERRAEYTARGIRDIITVMEWPSGLREVSGFFTQGRFGGQHGHATLAEWAKVKFGKGTLRKTGEGSIEGRKTTTYEVI